MSLTNEEIREFTLMALDQPSAVRKKEKSNRLKITIHLTEVQRESDYYIYYNPAIIDSGLIDWGDGIIEDGASTLYHKYSSTGTYHITITGDNFSSICFSRGSGIYNPQAQALISIDTKLPTIIGNDLSNLCYACINLLEIPYGLLDNCSLVENFSDSFNYCTSIAEIPDNLFTNCINAKNVRNCFNTCSSIISIPNNIFVNCLELNDITACFANCVGVVTSVPNLWDTYLNNINHRSCFRRCTNAANYLDIPSDWR